MLTNPETGALYGYIFNVPGHGAFDPNGRAPSVSQEEIDAHNRELAEIAWSAMLKAGRGVLYLTDRGITDWPSAHVIRQSRTSTSWHNFAGLRGRTDVWFELDGSTWHGVNIGVSQVLHVLRNKH